jgi:hypothetical protein
MTAAPAAPELRQRMKDTQMEQLARKEEATTSPLLPMTRTFSQTEMLYYGKSRLGKRKQTKSLIGDRERKGKEKNMNVNQRNRYREATETSCNDFTSSHSVVVHIYT